MQILTDSPIKIPVIGANDRPQKVLLLGFQDQDNPLGLRYLMSAINASGHEADISDLWR